MRRAIVIIAFFVFLAAIDALANDFRFTSAVYFEIREFGRLVNRFIGEAF